MNNIITRQYQSKQFNIYQPKRKPQGKNYNPEMLITTRELYQLEHYFYVYDVNWNIM